MAAKAVKSDITHVEAFSQLISKAKENMEISGLSDVRWMKEDALSYVQKEVKRGKLHLVSWRSVDRAETREAV